MAHPPHLLPSAANCHAIHRRGPCGHAAATFSGMRSSVGRVGRAEFDKLVTFRIGSVRRTVRRTDGRTRTDGVLLTAALKCTITMRSFVRRNNIGLSVVRAVARFVADQHRRRIDFSSLSFFLMDPQPSTHASERARETKFLLDEGAFFDWGRDAQTLSECSTEREMQMGLATQRVAKK